MLVDYITLRLAIKFFEFLQKRKFIISDIKILTYDMLRYNYKIYSTLSDLQSYFSLNYTNVYKCNIGKFSTITAFTANSNLYNFNLQYNIYDICDNTTITERNDYNTELIELRNKYKDIQLNALKSSINQYCVYSKEIKNIYISGIYSSCYAEPGWSEGTSRLQQLDNTINSNQRLFEIKTQK